MGVRRQASDSDLSAGAACGGQADMQVRPYDVG